MKMDPENMILFFDDVREKFSANGQQHKKPSKIKHELLTSKECFYVFDLTKGKIVYEKGLEQLLGTKKEDLFDGMPMNHIHPDDKETVFRITKATIMHCITRPNECEDSLLQLSYRFVQPSGNIIRLLSQSRIYEMNKEGIPLSIIVKLTDISFLESTLYVTWYFNASNLNFPAFKQQIYDVYKDFFSEREKDIIMEMEKGLTNKDIARKLSISEHTVATHRKNIFKKANRHNTKDLILFCKRKGII